MCRFLAYSGAPLLLSDLLYRPTNSLIMQSYQAKERREPLNGDGFGVGWYVPEIDPTPCVLRSTTPAWSNRNLQNLGAKTRVARLFAHVRAASPGMAVMEANVHPFQYDRFMWMHNGQVADFHKIRRALRESLRDEFYNMIVGTTDSEHAFALFLDNLHTSFADATSAQMREALVATIVKLNHLTRAAGIDAPSYYNFAVTDGATTVVSRFCSAADTPGASLHYSRGIRFVCHLNGDCDMETVGENERADAVIVSSERLTADATDYPDVPDNHTVTVLPDLTVEIERIEA